MTRYLRELRLVLTTLLSLACASPAFAQQDLIARMQSGGTVVFLRHAETDYSQIDTGRLDDRAGQRNLSEAGRAQARELGAAFEALDIEFAHVRTSPVYRARDTAELAFGPDAIEVTMDLVADDYAGGNLRDMIAATRGLLATEPPEGENLLLVGHRTPLEMVTGDGFPDTILPEGAMAVFAPGGGVTRLLGTVSPDALIAAAEAR
ncbi:histidine phosphatase family protein [uncultured Jannaschia sp.]|uniref:histidine phosphatase family protein n=1 Tax=uncultured Jannaschia sp. TaxID=293347 RepID=UPI002603F7FF|nr:histidine phosphatase family protein [uncultured Jannaschia sp.]